ncbi:tryptophan synthase beta subunit-like PLP-dependent enzyme [Hypomontagnella monticulosa]|nr:tryptophan synthase beta subunit-like PLP-dependent enzyme [Hypomontagnella monticulosa]
MDVVNPLNVFKGPDSIRNYFNPDEQPPVPLVELPEKLNPFRGDGVRIYVKLLTSLPAQNVKALPALNMLLNEPSAAERSLVEVSSGSTVTSLSIAARVLYDNDDTTAFVSNKAALDRVRELQFYGLRVALYGGPTYTETTDPRGPVEWARRLGRENDKILNLGQYDNVYNWKSHERWTGPQIWKQLPEINVFCMGMGSTGCVTGTGMYLKSQKPSVKVLGVCNVEADIVPGPRERPMHETSPFPWKEVVDFTEIVSSEESYRTSLRLSREGIITGPSTGMALKGLLNFLQQAKDNGTLNTYADKSTGEISCVFISCDLPQKHVDTYFKKLGPEEFKPIVNEELFAYDQHVYSFRWEIDPEEVQNDISGIIDQVKNCILSKNPGELTNGDSVSAVPSSIRFVDLRSRVDFDLCHVKSAYNFPMSGLTAETKSPFDFGDINALIEQSKGVDSLLKSPELSKWLSGATSPLVVLCYNGETSRLMTAALRAQGVEAYSFKGGMPGLAKYLDINTPGH